MNHESRESKFSLQHVELIILAATLLATVVMSYLTLRQTAQNAEIERTSKFVERLNSKDMVEIREDVDRWVETKETGEALYLRSHGKRKDGPPYTSDEARREAASALKTIAELRTMANYFQELGTALKIGSLNEVYAHALVGGLCVRYGNDLGSFIDASRDERKRKTAYEEVFLLRDRMHDIDLKLEAEAAAKAKNPPGK